MIKLHDIRYVRVGTCDLAAANRHARELLYQPRRFPRTDSSFCLWGSAPDIAEFRT